jgi:hypothetical protein
MLHACHEPTPLSDSDASPKELVIENIFGCTTNEWHVPEPSERSYSDTEGLTYRLR